jgi:hypothetical protein
LARKYLTEHLIYDIGPRELDAIARFFDMAADEGIIPAPPPLVCQPGLPTM